VAAPRPPGIAPAAGDPFRRLARRYLQAALAYFALGMLLGAVMIWFGNDNFQFLHSHMLLVGAGLFSAYGAGLRWIASGADAGPLPGVTPAMASGQFWLANVGLPGMLAGSVLPVGLGLDRLGVLFGFLEAAAGVLFAVLLSRALRNS
jgi:hypothetical protein